MLKQVLSPEVAGDINEHVLILVPVLLSVRHDAIGLLSSRYKYVPASDIINRTIEGIFPIVDANAYRFTNCAPALNPNKK